MLFLLCNYFVFVFFHRCYLHSSLSGWIIYENGSFTTTSHMSQKGVVVLLNGITIMHLNVQKKKTILVIFTILKGDFSDSVELI